MKKIIVLILSLSIIIIGPALWQYGGIVLLDYVVSSQPTISWYHPIMMSLINLSSNILGYEITSKGFFFVSLILSGYLGVYMARAIFLYLGVDEIWKKWIAIFGVIFFMLNPFLYERMMTQPTIYLGVIFLGYGLVALLSAEKELRKMLLSGAFFGLAWSMFPHAIFMIAAIYLTWIIFFMRYIENWKYIVGSGFIVILFNLNWLLAPIFGVTNSVSSISSFGENNIEAFLSNSLPPFGPIMTNLSLYGFWGERYQHFILPSVINPNWWYAALCVLAVVNAGIFLAFKKAETRRFAGFFLTILTISLIFGIGTASASTAPMMNWMYDKIPFFIGFREPQKWIGLVMIAYAFFFLITMATILQKWGKHLYVKIGLISGVFILFATWTPGVLFGFAGQLKAIQYPQEFEVLRTELIESSNTGSILALPWHSYIACGWTGGRVISNPIKDLLSPALVISSDNIEVGNILYTNSSDVRSQTIENFIRNTRDFSTLRPLDINKILLMKCADWKLYNWIDTDSSCKKTTDNNAYTLYNCQ